MENRLKERLTGAAILVALIVMVVPEMFRGQGNDVVSLPGSSGEGPPVRSYTIDLSNGPSRGGPLQSTPVRGANPGAGDKGGIVLQIEPATAPIVAAPAAQAAGAVAGGPPPAATSTAPAPPASTASAPAAPALAPPASAAATPVPAAAAPVASGPAATAPKASKALIGASSRLPPAPAHNSSEAGWIVQLGLFAKRENAERLALNAQGHGFAVSISNADARGLYRVYAGGMTDRSAAEAYSQRLKAQGLPAAVILSP
jgi:cell division septation protein DedD